MFSFLIVILLHPTLTTMMNLNKTDDDPNKETSLTDLDCEFNINFQVSIEKLLFKQKKRFIDCTITDIVNKTARKKSRNEHKHGHGAQNRNERILKDNKSDTEKANNTNQAVQCIKCLALIQFEHLIITIKPTSKFFIPICKKCESYGTRKIYSNNLKLYYLDLGNKLCRVYYHSNSINEIKFKLMEAHELKNLMTKNPRIISIYFCKPNLNDEILGN